MRKKYFTQIQNRLIEDDSVSDSAFRTYMVLSSFNWGSGEAYPSIERIAQKRGRSKNAIIKHLKILRNNGWIISKRESFSSTNRYRFIKEEKLIKVISLIEGGILDGKDIISTVENSG